MCTYMCEQAYVREGEEREGEYMDRQRERERERERGRLSEIGSDREGERVKDGWVLFKTQNLPQYQELFLGSRPATGSSLRKERCDACFVSVATEPR